MDPYASSNLSLVLAWVFALPFLSVIVLFPFAAIALIGACFFEKEQRFLKAFLVTVALFSLVFISPAPYLVFLMVLAAAYPAQSLFAFGTTIFPLSLYMPVVFAALTFVGIWAPFLLASLIAGFSFENQMKPWRALLGAAVLPVLCMFAAGVFLFVRELSGLTTGWLRTRDVIRATNGPAEATFRYVTLPFFLGRFDWTDPETDDTQKILRSHVAMQYLSNQKTLAVLKKNYPDIYLKWIDSFPQKVVPLDSEK
jgi:hypothetical protein